MKKKKPVKTLNRRIFEKIDYLIIGLCLVCIVISGIGLWYGSLDYSEAEDEYRSLGQYVQLIDDTEGDNGLIAAENQNGENQISDQLYQIDWEKLRKINPDIVAWITIPGTVVNYPIVQTTDNSKYLSTTFEGTKNACGTIFMNTYNRTNFSDWNTVLYGHNMRNGSMFAVLNKYKKESFYKEHKDVWIFTPFWERKYQIISAHEATDGTETYAIEFGEGGYNAHIASEVTQSIYDTENGYNVDLPMVTLSTCTGRGKLSRMVLICQPVYETPLDPFIENKTTDTSDTSGTAER